MKGHQIYEDWQGEKVLTLSDLIPPKPIAVCVGINPSPTSVATGHYYQGQLGQRFFTRLRYCELIDEVGDGFEDDAAVRRGVGFTDIVKRPTARADEVGSGELRAGVSLLEAKLELVRPQLVVFTFKKTAEILFGKFPGSGFVPRSTSSGSPCFVMPPPYASTHDTAAILDELRDWVAPRR